MTNINSNGPMDNSPPNSLKEWILATFSNCEIVHINSVGAGNAGYYKLNYYWETTELYKQYNKEIWKLLYDDAQNMGYSIFDVIGHLRNANNISSDEAFQHLLVLYAVEKIAFNIIKRGK